MILAVFNSCSELFPKGRWKGVNLMGFGALDASVQAGPSARAAWLQQAASNQASAGFMFAEGFVLFAALPGPGIMK